MAYYYFVSSLPMLAFGEPPPLSRALFREACAEHLRSGDLAALDALEAGPDEPSRHPFLNAWRDGETQLRNAAARQRAARSQRDAAPFLREQRGFDLSIESAVGEAFSRGTPLERERALDRVRWLQADALAGPDPFSSRAVLAYALRLRIAERWAVVDRDKGRETVDGLVAREAGQAGSGETT